MCTMLRLAAFGLVTSCVPIDAGAAPVGNACADLATLRIEDANLLSASVVPASALDYTGLVAWADPIVTPWRTLQYVEDVPRRMGT